MKVTTVLAAAAALMMTAGASYAAPKHYNSNGYGKSYGYSKQFNKRGISPRERATIARSAANVAALKRRSLRDGRITFAERAMIRNAERRHAALVTRLYRS